MELPAILENINKNYFTDTQAKTYIETRTMIVSNCVHDVVICISEGLSITSIIERTHDHRRLLHVYAFID